MRLLLLPERPTVSTVYFSSAQTFFYSPVTYIEAENALKDHVQCTVPDLGASAADEETGYVTLALSRAPVVGDDTTFIYATVSKQAMTYKTGTHATNRPAALNIMTRKDLKDINIQRYQRAPMWGNTEVTVYGANLYPSNRATCSFVYYVADWRTQTSHCDTTNGWTYCTMPTGGAHRCCKIEPAALTYDSTTADTGVATYYRCMSPKHEHKTVTSYTFAPSIEVEVLLSLEDEEAYTNRASTSSYTSASKDLSDGVIYSEIDSAQYCDVCLRISDLYVSPSGSDKDITAVSTAGGDGTPQRPYRTIQRALDRAVINSRHPSDYENGPYGLLHGQSGASGSDRQFNRDLVIVKQGFYRGPGNIGLRPRGKLVTIRSEWYHNANYHSGMDVTVDCANSGVGFLEERSQRYWDNDDNTERESIYVQGIVQKRCMNKRAYSVYDWANKRYTLHQNPMVLYHKPDATHLRNKRSVHPYANRFRPGWQGEVDANLIP